MIPCHKRRLQSMKRPRAQEKRQLRRQSIPITPCLTSRQRGHAQKIILPLLGKWFNRPANGRLAQPLIGGASGFTVAAPKTSKLSRQTKVIRVHDDGKRPAANASTAYYRCKPGRVALFHRSDVRKTFQLSCKILIVTELIKLGQENLASKL